MLHHLRKEARVLKAITASTTVVNHKVSCGPHSEGSGSNQSSIFFIREMPACCGMPPRDGCPAAGWVDLDSYGESRGYYYNLSAAHEEAAFQEPVAEVRAVRA